jgi:hypothetical protein
MDLLSLSEEVVLESLLPIDKSKMLDTICALPWKIEVIIIQTMKNPSRGKEILGLYFWR